MGVLTSSDVEMVMRRLCGVLRCMYRSNTDGKVSFVGAGLDDMTVGTATYTGIFPREFIVRISTTGSPDSIRYSTDNGATWASEDAITGSAQTLEDGVQVTFAATTGHTLGEDWIFTTNPGFGAEHMREYIANLTDIDVQYKMVSPAYTMGTYPAKSWLQYMTDVKAVYNGMVQNIGPLDAYLTTNTKMVNFEARDILNGLDPENVVPPVTTLGVFDYSGDAAGTFTAGSTVDVAKYNAGKLQVLALSDITGAGAGIASLDGLDFAGGDINKSTPAQFGAMTQYDVYDLSSIYSERFKSVSAVTVTGGLNGEKFLIRTQEDFSPVM